jgi:hypothetical protein
MRSFHRETQIDSNEPSVRDQVEAPNTACTRRVGVCAFSGTLCGSELVPAKWRDPVPPTRG